MLKVEVVKRHFVNTFLLKFTRIVGEWGDWPDHFLEQYTLCFVHWFKVGVSGERGGKCRSLCQCVYSEAGVTIVFSVSAFCFTLLYI